MTAAELDLTAAIEAAGGELSYGARALHDFRVDGEAVPHCACGWRADHSYDIKSHDQHIVEVILIAALPHIREQLAQQVDAGVYEVVLGDTPTVALSIRRQAARVVRGTP